MDKSLGEGITYGIDKLKSFNEQAKQRLPWVQEARKLENELEDYALEGLSDQDLINILGGVSVSRNEEGKVNPNQNKSMLELELAQNRGQQRLDEYRALVAQDKTDLETLRRLLEGKARKDQEEAIAAQNDALNNEHRTQPTVTFGPERDARIAAQTELAAKRRKAREALNRRF